MQDPKRALAELERASALPGIRGVYLGTNINGRDLSDPAFTPIFAACEARRLPVLLHPLTVIGAGNRLGRYYLNNFLGNPFDTAIAAAHLVFGGVLARFPRLEVCLPHARGACCGCDVTAEFWVTQTFNGLSYGALLFLLASGLSLIFGVMRIVNLAHGSYFMLGGYVGLSVVWRTGSYVLALVAGALALAVVGMVMERVFLRRLLGQTLGQVLMTIGFALIFQDLALLIWGGDPYSIRPPSLLAG